jgi:gas vesicle protein
MDDRGDFLAGLLIGGLVGLVVGVCFAPDSGEQTRSVIRDRASEALDRVRDAGGRLREGVGRVREGVGQVAESVRSRFSGADEQAAADQGKVAEPVAEPGA